MNPFELPNLYSVTLYNSYDGFAGCTADLVFTGTQICRRSSMDTRPHEDVYFESDSLRTES